MRMQKSLRITLEAAAVSVILAGINLLYPEDPGFSGLHFAPYALAAFLFASYYGTGYGLASLLLSSVSIIGLLPLVGTLVFRGAGLSVETFTGPFASLRKTAPVPVPVIAVITYLFGAIRAGHRGESGNRLKRFEDTSKENWRLRQENRALQTVNTEIEGRVSKQKDSMTSLYTQIRKLDTLDLGEGLGVLLETVRMFAGVTKASVWRFDGSRGALVLAAATGWEDGKSEAGIRLDDTIEGWVFRNTSIFSVRMILQYDNLGRMDTGRNIITLPISIGRKVWGVLNIEELPFEKYNLYTERILQIILSLAEHAVERAVEYQSLIETEEIDTVTGLPLFSQFHRMLEDETERAATVGGTVSVIILQIANYLELAERHDPRNLRILVKDLASLLLPLIDNRGKFFQYKEESQLAIIYQNLDFDGASLFCLEALERINSGTWRVGDHEEPLEMIVGYAAGGGTVTDADSLISQAENLLEMQKV